MDSESWESKSVRQLALYLLSVVGILHHFPPSDCIGLIRRSDCSSKASGVVIRIPLPIVLFLLGSIIL